MTLLDAGKLKGKQYILPLCFSVPTLTSAESVLKDSGFDMQAASKSLVATMDELLRIYKEKPMLVVMDFSMTSALSQPIIDYKNHIINLDTVSCRQTLAYEKEFRTGEISYEMQNGLFDSFNPEVVQDYFANGEPFASLDPSYMTVGLLRQCAALGIKTVTLPIPNELGSVTAEIGSYAMGNQNTKHPAEVKALLAYLLSEECQSSSAFADKDMFPVRRGCLKKCMEAQHKVLRIRNLCKQAPFNAAWIYAMKYGGGPVGMHSRMPKDQDFVPEMLKTQLDDLAKEYGYDVL